MFCYFCLKSKKKLTPLHQQKGVQILELQLCKDKKTKEFKDAVYEEAMRDMFSNTQCHVFRE